MFRNVSQDSKIINKAFVTRSVLVCVVVIVAIAVIVLVVALVVLLVVVVIVVICCSHSFFFIEKENEAEWCKIEDPEILVSFFFLFSFFCFILCSFSFIY